VKRAIAPAARGPGFAARNNRPSGEAASLALAAPAAGRVPTAGRARVAMRGGIPTIRAAVGIR